MRLYLILLLLQLGLNVEVSFSQNVCSNLPTVPHAVISGATTRVNYQEGHVIEFTCEPGFKSSQTPKYVCTSNGWLAVRQGTCFSCSTLPNVTHAVVSEETQKVDYQEGDMIKFICDTNHTSGETIKYICTDEGWLPVQQEVCVYITCTVPAMHQYLVAAQLPATERVKVGHTFQFECSNGFTLEGAGNVECLETGQWSAPFPTCAERCKVTGIPDGVYISTRGIGSSVNIGQELQFSCRNYRNFLHGEKTVQCSADGKWSHPFPTCGGPVGCDTRPPALEDGDTVSIQQFSYRHGDKVQYTCQNLYTMEGDPHMQCVNGEWRGRMICIKPCTVTREEMQRRNIYLAYKPREEKLYTPHNDFITFSCVYGTRRYGRVAMRQQCVDGVMTLPTCQ